MKTSDNITEFSAAFVKAQAEIKTAIHNDFNDYFKNSFANFESIVGAIREIAAKHDLSFIQLTRSSTSGEHPDVLFYIVTRILHSSGQWAEGDFPVLVPRSPDERPFSQDDPKEKKSRNRNLNQEIATSVSYLKRVALQLAWGVATAQDGDGNDESQAVDERAPSDRVAAPGEIEKILKAYSKIGVTKAQVLRFSGVMKQEELTERHIDDLWKVGQEIDAKKKKKNEVFK